MKRFVFILGLLAGWWPAVAVQGQTLTGTILHNNLTRDYRLYVPPGYNPSVPAPLVFNLHGYTSNAAQQEFYSEMNAVADTAGFLVVYPNGINNSWNSGFSVPYYGGVDDVGFLSKLIDTLGLAYNLDLSRVYSCGMSNGGFMSLRLACDLEGRIAAVASVTGTMTSLQFNNCSANRPVPVMQVHGTLDGTVAYLGNALSLSVDSVLSYWQLQNNCPGPVVHDTLPDLNVFDGSTVTTQQWGGCQDGTEVLHYKVAGGGHTWPGAIPLAAAGNTNQDFDASRAIWEFFLRHQHPGPAASLSAGAEDDWAVGPNPFGVVLQMNDPVGGAWELVDLNGKTVLEGTLHPRETSVVSTRDLANGMYLLRTSGRSRLLLKR